MTFLEWIFNRANRVLALDTEFRSDLTNTHPKNVICYVYKDLRTGEVYRFTKENRYGDPHFDFENTLVVCHYALAECGSFLADYIPLPKNIWCTWTEEKNVNNAYTDKFDLLNTARRYGYKDILSDVEKTYFRDLILNNTEYSKEQLQQILDYCQTDVEATGDIFLEQVNLIQKRFKLKTVHDFETYFHQALTRGRAHSDFARIYKTGIPVNLGALTDFNKYWSAAKKTIIKDFNKDLNCFDEYSFNLEKFGELLKQEGLYNTWPRTFKGKLSTRSYDFEDCINDKIKKVGEVKKLLSQTNLKGFSISNDGRSKAPLRPFSTQTGRCAPGGSDFPFNASKWIRKFICPPIGKVLAYIDYTSQEFAIQAYLSNDLKMIESYESGDPYLRIAKFNDDIPEHGTKETHGEERDVWKQVVLANSYGMGAESLAARIKRSPEQARIVLKKYKRLFSKYFKWIEIKLNNAERDLHLRTVLGWTLNITKWKRLKATSYQNYPIQSHGAEILRNAIRLLHDNNIIVNCTVHDAVLIEVDIVDYENQIKLAQDLMARAAKEIIGADIRTDVKIIDHKGYIQKDKNAEEMFDKIMGAIKTTKESYQSDSSGPYIYKYI